MTQDCFQGLLAVLSDSKLHCPKCKVLLVVYKRKEGAWKTEGRNEDCLSYFLHC